MQSSGRADFTWPKVEITQTWSLATDNSIFKKFSHQSCLSSQDQVQNQKKLSLSKNLLWAFFCWKISRYPRFPSWIWPKIWGSITPTNLRKSIKPPSDWPLNRWNRPDLAPRAWGLASWSSKWRCWKRGSLHLPRKNLFQQHRKSQNTPKYRLRAKRPWPFRRCYQR